MSTTSIMQCGKALDFRPRKTWPSALPAMAWRGELLCGFERIRGEAVDLYGCTHAPFIEAVKACHPELGLGELARLSWRLSLRWPELYPEFREGLFRAYDLRWSDRLQATLAAVLASPAEFQAWCDDKRISPRDLASLLALPQSAEFAPFLQAIARVPVSRSEGARAIELGVELYLLGHPLNDILPSENETQAFLRRLEKWRRPQTVMQDEEWKTDVERWPWPAQVHGQWQRVGDVSGLEIKIRATSPEDLGKKLERLQSIGNVWSCKN